jgi:hypothetical protein
MRSSWPSVPSAVDLPHVDDHGKHTTEERTLCRLVLGADGTTSHKQLLTTIIIYYYKQSAITAASCRVSTGTLSKTLWRFVNAEEFNRALDYILRRSSRRQRLMRTSKLVIVIFSIINAIRLPWKAMSLRARLTRTRRASKRCFSHRHGRAPRGVACVGPRLDQYPTKCTAVDSHGVCSHCMRKLASLLSCRKMTLAILSFWLRLTNSLTHAHSLS